jgi:hypothetical protein
MMPAMAMAVAKSKGPSDFDLIANRYQNVIALPVVLEQIGKTPEGRATIAHLFEAFSAKTGVTFPPEAIEKVQDNPKLVMQVLEVTPKQMSVGIGQINEAYKLGKIKQPAPEPTYLPQKFDFANIAQVVSPPRVAELKQLAPGLFTGSLPSAVSEPQIRNNRVMAETFRRLTGNAGLPADQQFEVTFQGKPYTRLNDFVGALRDAGYQVDVSFESRVANFTELKTVVPGSNPVQYLDVPAPVMARTGYRDGQNNNATLPVAHSEMNISVKAGPSTKGNGPNIDADLRFFQGMGSTGFFAANLTALPEWLGHTSHGSLSGDKAADAINVASTYTRLINKISAEKNLYASGYGLTGVCNDSVAVVQQVVLGTSDQYPLLMKDALLTPVIGEMLHDADTSDDATLMRIQRAIATLDSDTSPNSSARRRALASVPYAPGREPFSSTVQGIGILQEK